MTDEDGSKRDAENRRTMGQSANDSRSSPAPSASKASQQNQGRRIQDKIASKDPTHKLNLDRRVPNSDRRKFDDPNYKGPARRMTIDRRVNLKDRRKSED